jgi:prevent-host-death family protein
MASPVTTTRPSNRSSTRSTKRPKSSPAKNTPSGRALSDLTPWKLEDAKARFSEIVRLASSDGPQLVTVRGKEAAVILDPETYRRLLPSTEERKPISEFLRGLKLLSKIDITRAPDTGRDFEF